MNMKARLTPPNCASTPEHAEDPGDDRGDERQLQAVLEADSVLTTSRAVRNAENHLEVVEGQLSGVRAKGQVDDGDCRQQQTKRDVDQERQNRCTGSESPKQCTRH